MNTVAVTGTYKDANQVGLTGTVEFIPARAQDATNNFIVGGFPLEVPVTAGVLSVSVYPLAYKITERFAGVEQSFNVTITAATDMADLVRT